MFFQGNYDYANAPDCYICAYIVLLFEYLIWYLLTGNEFPPGSSGQ